MGNRQGQVSPEGDDSLIPGVETATGRCIAFGITACLLHVISMFLPLSMWLNQPLRQASTKHFSVETNVFKIGNGIGQQNGETFVLHYLLNMKWKKIYLSIGRSGNQLSHQGMDIHFLPKGVSMMKKIATLTIITVCCLNLLVSVQAGAGEMPGPDSEAVWEYITRTSLYTNQDSDFIFVDEFE